MKVGDRVLGLWVDDYQKDYMIGILTAVDFEDSLEYKIVADDGCEFWCHAIYHVRRITWSGKEVK